MKRLLTDQTLRALPVPVSGRTITWDTKVARLGVRVLSGGARTFFVQYKRRGRTQRITLGHYPALPLVGARTRARQLLAQVEQGNDPAAARQADHEALTMAELAHEYLEHHAKLNKRDWKADERTLRVDVLPVIGRRVGKEITRRDVRDLVEGIVKRAPVHANRVLSLVKKVLAVAVDRELLPVNVAAGLARPTRETPRTKVLTQEEVRSIVAALETEPTDVRDLLTLRFLTATRTGEALAMRVRDLDLDARTWTIPPEVAKTHQALRVPLVDQAVTILRARAAERGADAYVFPTARPTLSASGRRTGVWDAYDRIRRKSGVDLKGHDTRRWWASTAASLGVPHEVIARALGHQVPGITAKHYAVEGYAPAVRHAMERVARHLDSILTQAEPQKVVPLRA